MPMMFNQTEGETERRYDRQTIEKVVALAGKLQNEHQETLTAREVEALGAEVGLEPAFVQKALRRLTEEHEQAVRKKTVEQTPVEEARISKSEFMALMVAYSIPILWACIASVVWYRHSPLAMVAYVILPPLISAVLGFLTGRAKSGFKAGVVMAFAMFLSFLAWMAGLHHLPLSFRLWMSFAIFILGGVPVAGGLGALGGYLRERYFPPRWIKRKETQGGATRQELLDLLFTLQGRLESQKQHRAFLSVDVADSAEMKRSAPELTVEHSFGQYGRWVEEVARANGGEMQSVAGDGVMAIFPTDAGALRAARQLQEGLPQFNAALNRLPQAFRLRCGVSAGPVALETGMPPGHLQSPVIDRAAILQRRAAVGDIVVGNELAAAGLVELGELAPLPEVGGETLFSWRAGQRNNGISPQPLS